MCRPSAMAMQGSHWPHGSGVGWPLPSVSTQFKARAMIRAVVVLPTPRIPVRRNACATRPLCRALVRVRTRASWPISSERRCGR
jgi:hypothetical protein